MDRSTSKPPSISTMPEEYNIIEHYELLVERRDWAQALQVIEEIISINPDISTSWFNYGVCLDALEKHIEAANAFENAFALNQEDFGAQYRMFRSLHLAKNYARFISLLREECDQYPEFINNFIDDPDFGPLFENEPFKEFALAYLRR